ncbi:TetR family transcriptional regulator [Conexibacter woesei]|uniref:TetR family transcriptional regulator n=1 Tax=Conexibacter woesei TaxID=191495 RepID=UPI00041D6B22|nr:TetR family transcriptional regulator [Conexibacter woesei]
MGLRERKKEQTRRAIEDAAFRLFEDRGYAATTVADIAEAADIAPRTFFSYFPSKEAVVFGDFDEVFDALETRMRDRADDENAFEALREWIGELIARGHAEDDGDREWLRHCLVRDNDALAAHERHIMGRFETLIAESVAIDLGSAPDDLQPKLIAAAAVAALMALSGDDEDRRAKKKHGPDEADLARLDEAFTFLRGGIAALQEVRGTAPQQK